MGRNKGRNYIFFALILFMAMKRNIIFILCSVLSFALIVAGFFVPPMGVIDGSVLQAVGLLLGFGVVAMIPDIISQAKNAKITTAGGTNIEIETHHKTKKQDENKSQANSEKA